MNKGTAITIILLLALTLLNVKEIIHLQKEVKTWQKNYELVANEKEALKKYYVGKLALYETSAHEMALKEFRRIYRPYLDSLERMGLKRISRIENLVATIHSKQTTTARDTLDSLKVWRVKMPSIQVTTIEHPDNTRAVTIQARISLTITRSLKPRQGIIRKILLIPIRREPVYTVIPSDTTVKIDQFKVFELY